MLKINVAIAVLLSVVNSLSAQTNGDAIVGIWETEARDARMEIFKNGAQYHGRLLWGSRIVEADGKTSRKDSRNPDPKLRPRIIIGIVNLTGLRYDGGEYVEGQIYDPPSGKTYDCKARIEQGKLLLRGFIGISAFGKTATWHKL
jgi:uncharacterized protein (DUF2147 family)